MQPDFLLNSPLARRLYRTCAARLPIIDYHNHLDARAVAQNRQYENIAELWVKADPYKHRAMRILGVREELITGSCSDYEKFQAWYGCLPRLIGNPLFDWSQMELSRVFGYHLLPLRPCEEVWQTLNERLSKLSTADILAKFNIEYSAPCAGITDDLSVFDGKCLCPSLRGDDMLLPTAALIGTLSEQTGTAIENLSGYLAAVRARLDAFRNAGCRFSDHALDNGFCYISDDGENDRRFAALLSGQALTGHDAAYLRSYILRSLLSAYAQVGFTVQLHIGAQRTTSARLRALAGPAGGYAAVGSTVDVASLTNLLDETEQMENGLPNVLLFTLNPADNAVMATLCGSYSADGREALVSQGPAWWWCDHFQGMTDMLNDFTCHSVLSSFVGMTTDSRSILSFVRHDYFRRLLCQWLADMVDSGRMPKDMTLLQDTLSRMCYYNAKNRIGGL